MVVVGDDGEFLDRGGVGDDGEIGDNGEIGDDGGVADAESHFRCGMLNRWLALN